jgi:serine/threonine-protein kinase
VKYSAGQVLGRYELLVPIAKGGMAQVWAARLRGSRGFQKIVAIKIIRAGTNDDARMEQMFLEEATIASQIHHPNVVGTMELGDHEGTLYLVMEWVEGEALAQVMKQSMGRGGIPISIAVNLIAQACKGLHAAHELRDEAGAPLGVVHRDVSPQNVLVTYSGTAKLVDFGVAKVNGRDGDLTQDGEVKGKFAYMAPEQVSGGHVDRRTDIFAMGILLYFLTTGRHPFIGENTAQTLQNITSKKPPEPPSSLVAGYPLELEAVVMKALGKEPNDRWASASDMLSALEVAVPACHEGSFEGRVGEFMKELFGERARERRAQLRLAQEIADRSLPESQRSSSPTSVGSLRAVSFDGSPYSTHAGETLRSAKLTLEESFAPMPSVRAQVRPRRRHRWPLAVVAAIGTFVLLSFAGRIDWQFGARRGAATGQAPAAVEPVASAPPPPPPVAASASAAPRPVEVVEEIKDEAASKAPRKGPSHPAAPGKPAPPRPNGPTPAPAAAPAPAAPEHAPPQDGPNVWDKRF